MNRRMRRALEAVSQKNKKKDIGPWPVGEQATKRLAAIQKDFEQDQAIAQLRASSRAQEVLEILRPDGIPEEAVYNPQAKVFVLPMEDQDPQAAAQETPSEPKTPEEQAAEDEFNAERIAAAEALSEAVGEEHTGGPRADDPDWTA